MSRDIIRVAAVLALGIAPALSAQVRASERGTVSQTVDGTVITVDYSRPQIRGRDSVFASKGKGIVHWGETWTPGANWASTFEFSKPVTVNEHEVAAGKYSVWFVPDTTAWRVQLHPNPRLFHTQAPKDSGFALSVTVPTRVADHQESVLLFSFPKVTRTGTTLRMHWERTVLDLDIGVRPSRPPTSMTAAQMAPYLGGYTMRMEGDTTERKAEVLAARSALRIVVDGWPDYAMELIPTQGQHRFITAFLQKGELFDVEDQALLVFDMDGSRCVGFRIIDLTENKDWITAKRRT